MLLRAVIWRAASERIPNTDSNSLGKHYILKFQSEKTQIKYKTAFKHIPEHTTVEAVKE